MPHRCSLPDCLQLSVQSALLLLFAHQVKVECLYEPPQETSPQGFILQDDPKEETVEALAKLLGLQKVGWIFAHPPREEGFQFSSAEV